MSPAKFRIIMINSVARLSGGYVARRQERAIDIASSLSLTSNGRDRWTVSSQRSSRDYRVSGESCNCPDDRYCKHLWAVRYVTEYAEELARRLDQRTPNPRKADFMDELVALEKIYAQLTLAASRYRPPEGSMLYSLGLEAIGDDAVQAERMCRKGNVQFIPARIGEVRLERPWVARIVGLCPKYEFARVFQDGKKDYRDANKTGSRGVFVYYHVPPGLYEIQELTGRDTSRRFFASVENLNHVEVSKEDLIKQLTAIRVVVQREG